MRNIFLYEKLINFDCISDLLEAIGNMTKSTA